MNKRTRTIVSFSMLLILLLVMACQPEMTSEKKPWSVYTGSFRQASDAKRTAARLRKDKYPAYVISRLSENGDVEHAVHVGAFQDKREAETLAGELKGKGLKVVYAVVYSDFAEEAGAWDKASKSVRKESAVVAAPDLSTVPEHLAVTLKTFPVDDNFNIISLKIADSRTVRNNESIWDSFDLDYSFTPPGLKLATMIQGTSGIAQAVYEDQLYGGQIGVTILSAEEGAGKQAEIKEAFTAEKLIPLEAPDQFRTSRGIMTGEAFQFEGMDGKPGFCYVGLIKESGHVLLFLTREYDRDGFVAFLGKSNGKEGLLHFPEVRKSLSVTPGQSTGLGDIIAFTLDRVAPAYAAERDNAWWAKSMVGNWQSCGYFIKEDKPYIISIFNLTQEASARKVFDSFCEEKTAFADDTTNHESPLNGERGWYVTWWEFSEHSFSHGPLIVAVNSLGWGADEAALTAISANLTVW